MNDQRWWTSGLRRDDFIQRINAQPIGLTHEPRFNKPNSLLNELNTQASFLENVHGLLIPRLNRFVHTGKGEFHGDKKLRVTGALNLAT